MSRRALGRCPEPLSGTVAAGNVRGGRQGLGEKRRLESGQEAPCSTGQPAGLRQGAQEGAGGLSIPPCGNRSAVQPLRKKRAVKMSRPLCGSSSAGNH